MIIRDRTYLKWQRTQPCLICGKLGDDQESVVAAHIGTAGRGLKSSDAETIPLCNTCHHECHQFGEMTMLRKKLPTAILRLALRAYAQSLYHVWRGE